MTDVEMSHGTSILELCRDVKGLKLANNRLFDGLNNLGAGMALIMERLDIPPISLPVASPPTEAEIEAAPEEDYS
ncbi:hypothetical protein NDR87_30140 [Nocardia sp. CDC159]|uniref:Uncharacterized protein n=1 Tax=Nocardia pulmonis TaxID=2951408 RepID=A0A9X2EEX7_9NOCA|nr:MULTISPECIES: hypothetical protein [Nocardia]MCM6777753.1 hypothetical protein [Nocardia pulmonis]MCM6790638.1 hypothetical protein [Nocardia sp. CDC159]